MLCADCAKRKWKGMTSYMYTCWAICVKACMVVTVWIGFFSTTLRQELCGIDPDQGGGKEKKKADRGRNE